MEKSLNAIDALKIAIKQEQDGNNYYTKVAKIVEDKDLSKLIKRLAKDEAEHEKIFKNFLNQLEKNGDTQEFEFQESIANFLSVFVDTVFEKKIQDVDKLIKKMKSDLDILDHAIANEKDTLIFFMELKNISMNKHTGKIFDKIIQEEREHIVSLTKVYSDMTRNVLNKNSR